MAVSNRFPSGGFIRVDLLQYAVFLSFLWLCREYFGKQDYRLGTVEVSAVRGPTSFTLFLDVDLSF